MQKVTADYIYTGVSEPIKNGTVVVDSEGKICSVHNERLDDAQFFSGIICPGFINVHAHIELSYAKGKIPKGGGIDLFIHQLEELKRKTSQDEKTEAITDAILQMQGDGIVAVGDILNTTDSIEAKNQSDLFFYNFIEIYGSQTKDALHIWDGVLGLYSKISDPKNIVPHAPYSLSRTLFQKVRDFQKDNSTLSIHHMESASEADFFIEGKGALTDRFKAWGLELPSHIPTHKRPLESLYGFMQTSTRQLLIHNTFINDEDIQFAKTHLPNVFFGLCPNANLYIEDSLPPLDLLRKEEVNICLGTDSLASNNQLSILEEMKTLENYFGIGAKELIEYACINGALALGIDSKFGSIEEGKSPGLAWIKDVNFNYDRPLENATAQPIIL